MRDPKISGVITLGWVSRKFMHYLNIGPRTVGRGSPLSLRATLEPGAAGTASAQTYFTSTLIELYQAARSSISPLLSGLAMMLMISFWRLPLR